MADEIKYDYKTVQTIRGTNGLVISKMEKDGWELLEQASGTLHSTSISVDRRSRSCGS